MVNGDTLPSTTANHTHVLASLIRDNVHPVTQQTGLCVDLRIVLGVSLNKLKIKIYEGVAGDASSQCQTQHRLSSFRIIAW